MSISNKLRINIYFKWVGRVWIDIFIRPPDKSLYLNSIILISQPKQL